MLQRLLGATGFSLFRLSSEAGALEEERRAFAVPPLCTISPLLECPRPPWTYGLRHRGHMVAKYPLLHSPPPPRGLEARSAGASRGADGASPAFGLRHVI